MPVSDEMLKTLMEQGFKYNFDHDIYINRQKKCIISQEALNDHDDNWLQKKLEQVNRNNWNFIFSGKAPSSSVKAKILRKLNLEK